METHGITLFRKVVFLSALPFIMTGLRIGLARGWRAAVAEEMIAATWGMGWMIFESRQFLQTDIMVSGIILIGVIGLLVEGVIFQTIEKHTIIRWGMVTDLGKHV
ncbi:MAG: ABC transporter permease subunit [Nitrospinota bacterium]